MDGTNGSLQPHFLFDFGNVAVVMETPWELNPNPNQWCFHSINKTLYLSSVPEGEILPAEVSDDSRRQGITQHVDHGPEPVTMETKISAKCSKLSKGAKLEIGGKSFKFDGY